MFFSVLPNGQRCLAVPTDPDELARHFTLEKFDLDLIGQRRHDRNRLGMALPFTLIRYPGMTLAPMIASAEPVCGPDGGATTSMRCSQPSSPTAPISASRAWLQPASQGVTRDQLVWTKDAYVREDGYHRALAILIEAHSRLPIASTWATGSRWTIASTL